MTIHSKRTSTAAVALAHTYVGKAAYSNMCQTFVIDMFGLSPVGDYDGDHHADAQDGWEKAKAHGHVVLAKDITSYNDIPAGVALCWLGGSHLFGHTAVSIGKGKMISTDAYKLGSWGRVGIQDIGYVSKYWRNGLTFVGYYTTDGNGVTITDPPKAPPAPVEYETVDVFYQNLALYNRPDQPGITGWKTHIPAICRNAIAAKPDVALFTELGNTKAAKGLPVVDARLDGHLTRVKGGTDGRYVYNGANVKRVASGNFVVAKSTWYAGDDKQAAWEVFTKNGIRGAVMTYQLAFQDGHAADVKRVEQALDFLHQFEAVLRKYGVRSDNALILGDTNSEGMVAAAMTKAGWPHVSPASVTPTFNGWGKGRGTRIDYAFTKGKKTHYVVTPSKNSDHNQITLTLSLRKA